MKKLFLIPTLFLALIFGSCVKDKNYKTFTIYRPHYSVRQEIKDRATFQQAQPMKNLGSFVLYNSTMYISEKNKGIHVIDYSAPTSPVNRGFIPIPGNNGLSIRNNFLYADCYSDLFVFRISSKEKVELQNSVQNMFTPHFAYDTTVVQLTWIKKDTTVTEEYYNRVYLPNAHVLSAQSVDTKNNLVNNIPSTGYGNSLSSSMSVFTIVNDYLYTIDGHQLYSFSLQDPTLPSLKSKQEITWNVETIFPFKDKLFIGSMDGMFIYSISDPATPSFISRFNHVRVCDPVIADEKNAFVTLRNGSRCGGFINQMDILDIETITEPKLIKSVPFTNPHGLSKDQNVLFVCDGNSGLKVIDASDVNNMIVRQTITTNSKAVDVVAYKSIAFVMLEDAVQFYQYDQQFNVNFLSTIVKN